MEKKFKIEMPELNINRDQRIKEINNILREDFEKGGLLNQCLVFTYNQEVVTTTELTDLMTKYYQKEIQKSTVFRALNRLVKMDILFSRNSGYLMTTDHQELSEVERLMYGKFKKFLNNIPVAFKNRYTDVNFFAISNGWGLEFIEWSCKILNFKCKEEK